MTARLLELLNRLHASGRTIVISTHDLELAYAWAGIAFVLRRGELLAQGTPEQVFSDPNMLRSARFWRSLNATTASPASDPARRQPTPLRARL